MKYFLILLIFPLTLWAQTWTEPINITPNLPGLDNQPDLCIDKNGTLHCVFTHKLASNWRKIYYTKSTDDGISWTVPEDISLNSDTSLMNPHIVADTNNILYVTYDYNTMSPAVLLIKLKIFNGTQWSEAFTVSEGMYGSEHNRLFIDNNNRLYVFWIYQTHLTYYRYLESSIWSDIICPYPGDHLFGILPAVIDNENNLHFTGAYAESYPPVHQRVIYVKYDFDEDIWSEKTIVSSYTMLGSNDLDIDIDNQTNPNITYRQKNYYAGQYNDSTMYTFYNGSAWSEPELVVNDPHEQKIAIAPYNRVNIIDREKLETGTKLVHYQKINDLWQGYIIDESDIVVGNPQVIEKNNILYLIYYECYSNDDCRIKFTKNYLTTEIKHEQGIIDKMKIYPNPFKTQTTIEFEINKEKQIDISIYNLNGKHIQTIENKEFSPGTYKFIWLGTDKNGKEVKAGLYLVRLLTGRHVITKPVEYVK